MNIKTAEFLLEKAAGNLGGLIKGWSKSLSPQRQARNAQAFKDMGLRQRVDGLRKLRSDIVSGASKVKGIKYNNRGNPVIPQPKLNVYGRPMPAAPEYGTAAIRAGSRRKYQSGKVNPDAIAYSNRNTLKYGRPEDVARIRDLDKQVANQAHNLREYQAPVAGGSPFMDRVSQLAWPGVALYGASQYFKQPEGIEMSGSYGPGGFAADPQQGKAVVDPKTGNILGFKATGPAKARASQDSGYTLAGLPYARAQQSNVDALGRMADNDFFDSNKSFSVGRSI